MAGQAPWRSQAATALRRGGRNGEINGGAFVHVEGRDIDASTVKSWWVGLMRKGHLQHINTVHRKFVAVGLNHG